ncbi:MAG: thiamine phosphate synthase [Acidaminococcaceae bacterium]
MSTYRICVTNRHLSDLPLAQQIKLIAQLPAEPETLAADAPPRLWRPQALLLREKDLSPAAYLQLCLELAPLCQAHKLRLLPHSDPSAARRLQSTALHLPLRLLTTDLATEFPLVGVSVHSLEEALTAAHLGAGYLVVGHVFSTACKKELPPCGLTLLATIIQAVTIPVYAIGGLTPTNVQQCLQVGASGVCMMSTYMQVKNR